MGLFGPTKLEFSLQKEISNLEREIGILRVGITETEQEVDEARAALAPLEAEVEEYKQSLEALTQASGEREADLEAEIEEFRVQGEKVLDEHLEAISQDKQEIDPEDSSKTEVELENERAQAILRDQAVRELENDNKDFAERESELQAEIQKYRDREQEHLEIIQRVFQRVGKVVSEEAGKFQTQEDGDSPPDLIESLQNLDYEQEFQPDESEPTNAT